MFRKDTRKSFVFGFITFFVLAFILDLFGMNTVITKTIIIFIIILTTYFVMQIQKENSK